MNEAKLKNIIEAALLAAGRPLGLDQLQGLFDDHERPERDAVRQALEQLAGEYEPRGVRLAEVASGWRIQIRQEYSEWLSRLWQERPPRYSRALLETLAMIAYRQPITRGEIEDIRGVSVSSSIMRTILDRGWVRVVGHRDVPGRPAMYATTRDFLDYFGLKTLDQLPTLAEIRDLDSINVELEFGPMQETEAAALVEGSGEGGTEEQARPFLAAYPGLSGAQASDPDARPNDEEAIDAAEDSGPAGESHSRG